MEIEIKHQPAFALAVVRLAPTEEIKVEPGAMVSFSAGVTSETDVTGGLMRGIQRLFGGESFFQNTFRAPEGGGEITLAPTLVGDTRLVGNVYELPVSEPHVPGQQAAIQSPGCRELTLP
jgi:uncharacterized protein (AIM24 family)